MSINDERDTYGGKALQMKLKDRARRLKTDIPAIGLALRDRETPLLAKIIAGIVIVYALSPVDLIPDFIPVLGYFDDLIILPALITLVIKLIPDETMHRCRLEVEGRAKLQKKWVYAIPFVSVWVLLVLIIMKYVV